MLKKFIVMVFPGSDDVLAKFLRLTMALMSELLPTLLRPKKRYSDFSASG
jgi:hypothetical protein